MATAASKDRSLADSGVSYSVVSHMATSKSNRQIAHLLWHAADVTRA